MACPHVYTIVQRCPDLEDKTQELATKYGKALLYSKCHGEFNSSKVFMPAMVSSLRKPTPCNVTSYFNENDIDDFFSYYCSFILEVHVAEFLGDMGVGIGMVGEQGVESIHIVFNTFEWTYSSMFNKVQRLKSMVVEHHCHHCCC